MITNKQYIQLVKARQEPKRADNSYKVDKYKEKIYRLQYRLCISKGACNDK